MKKPRLAREREKERRLATLIVLRYYGRRLLLRARFFCSWKVNQTSLGAEREKKKKAGGRGGGGGGGGGEGFFNFLWKLLLLLRVLLSEKHAPRFFLFG